MDIGIRAKTALVCAASKGLGKGCAVALGREGVNLVITARGKEALDATAEEIRKSCAVTVAAVVGDITTEERRKSVFKIFSSPDILVKNPGGPPPPDFPGWNPHAWLKANDPQKLTPPHPM